MQDEKGKRTLKKSMGQGTSYLDPCRFVGSIRKIFMENERGLGLLLFFVLYRWETLFVLHRLFESLDALSKSLSQFRKFSRAENNQNDHKDQDQVHGLKKSFEHGFIPPSRVPIIPLMHMPVN